MFYIKFYLRKLMLLKNKHKWHFIEKKEAVVDIFIVRLGQFWWHSHCTRFVVCAWVQPSRNRFFFFSTEGYHQYQLAENQPASHISNSSANRAHEGGYSHFNCNICGTLLLGNFQYRKHMDRFHPSHNIAYPYKCPDCGKGFFSAGGLGYHKEIHLEKSLCHICQLSFSYSRNLKRHIEMLHNLKECRYCKQWVSSDSYEYHRHIRECSMWWWLLLNHEDLTTVLKCRA